MKIIRMRSNSAPRLSSNVVDLMIEAIGKLRKMSLSHKPGTAEAVAWSSMAQAIAKLRGRTVVMLEDITEAAESILIKRSEDEDVVINVIKEVFGIEIS